MPCGVVDLGPLIKEALLRMPVAQVGPDCVPDQSCGHANLDARRSPRRLRGASVAADGATHRDGRGRYGAAWAASAGVLVARVKPVAVTTCSDRALRGWDQSDMPPSTTSVMPVT